MAVAPVVEATPVVQLAMQVRAVVRRDSLVGRAALAAQVAGVPNQLVAQGVLAPHLALLVPRKLVVMVPQQPRAQRLLRVRAVLVGRVAVALAAHLHHHAPLAVAAVAAITAVAVALRPVQLTVRVAVAVAVVRISIQPDLSLVLT